MKKAAGVTKQRLFEKTHSVAGGSRFIGKNATGFGRWWPQCFVPARMLQADDQWCVLLQLLQAAGGEWAGRKKHANF